MLSYSTTIHLWWLTNNLVSTYDAMRRSHRSKMVLAELKRGFKCLIAQGILLGGAWGRRRVVWQPEVYEITLNLLLF